jgi:DNA repair exonuclease SbcCD ATPase subunit
MHNRRSSSTSSTPMSTSSSSSSGSLGGGFVVVATPAKRLNAESRIAQLDAENKRLLASITDFERMKQGLEATIESLAGSLAGLDDLQQPRSSSPRRPARTPLPAPTSPVFTLSSSTSFDAKDDATATTGRMAGLEKEVERLRRQTEEGEKAMSQLRDLSHAYAELAFRFLDDKATIEFTVSHG